MSTVQHLKMLLATIALDDAGKVLKNGFKPFDLDATAEPLGPIWCRLEAAAQWCERGDWQAAEADRDDQRLASHLTRLAFFLRGADALQKGGCGKKVMDDLVAEAVSLCGQAYKYMRAVRSREVAAICLSVGVDPVMFIEEDGTSHWMDRGPDDGHEADIARVTAMVERGV
jgi:hypothetical protein